MDPNAPDAVTALRNGIQNVLNGLDWLRPSVMRSAPSRAHSALSCMLAIYRGRRRRAKRPCAWLRIDSRPPAYPARRATEGRDSLSW